MQKKRPTSGGKMDETNKGENPSTSHDLQQPGGPPGADPWLCVTRFPWICSFRDKGNFFLATADLLPAITSKLLSENFYFSKNSSNKSVGPPYPVGDGFVRVSHPDDRKIPFILARRDNGSIYSYVRCVVA
jgi:hypothetical protein